MPAGFPGVLPRTHAPLASLPRPPSRSSHRRLWHQRFGSLSLTLILVGAACAAFGLPAVVIGWIGIDVGQVRIDVHVNRGRMVRSLPRGSSADTGACRCRTRIHIIIAANAAFMSVCALSAGIED